MLGVKQRLLFFSQKSNIHGLRFILNETGHFLSRFFWLIIVIVSAGCLYILLLPVFLRGSVVNFAVDTLYLDWNTKFPAVTVCEAYNFKMAQRRFAELYPDFMGPLDYTKRKHFTDLLFGRGTCSKSLCLPCGDEVPCDVPWREMADNVRKKCEDILTECQFNGVPFGCCERFHRVDSEYGICYSFNSLQHKHADEKSLVTVNQTTGPGHLTFRLLIDSKISVHSTEELSTNNLDLNFKFDVLTSLENRAEYTMTVVDMDNEPVVDEQDIETRQCRYQSEIPTGMMHTYPIYSYGACKLALETAHNFEHCQCVHPIRDQSYEKLYCNFTGLNCILTLQAQINILGVEENDIEGDCLPSCIESELSTIHLSKYAVEENDHVEGTLVTVKMSSLPTLQYQRGILRTNLDLVVTVGGLAGLFFGASILSVVETVYLLIRRQ